MNTEEIIAKLTDEEKIALVSGTRFMYTNPVSRFGIKSISMSDGPHGLRKQSEEYDNGIAMSEPATAFPTASLTASSFNEENLYKMGEAIAEECLHYGVDMLLGPGTNIKRNSLCGRNFEYFSEDPYLAGKMSAAMISGVKSKGVGVSLKHFALNNSENYRLMGDSIADVRAIREIYLKPFEIAVKEAKPDTVMCAYNKINGTYCSENKWLLNDVLRDEWGFEGAVMTDWGAMHNRTKALTAGLDIEMPGDTAICRKQIYDSLADQSVRAALDKSSVKIVDLANKYLHNERIQADFESHNKLAQEIAEDSAVLLKNDSALPLSLDDNLCVIGDLFVKMRYQGAGSSLINAIKVTTPKSAFDSASLKYTFARGYRENEKEPYEAIIDEACDLARSADKILLFIGLTEYFESEGCDRADMKLPENQLALVERLSELGKKIVVVLFGGSPVELPFESKVDAILNMYLPGQNGGSAVFNLLFGNKNPSGKLAESWVKDYSRVPNGSLYSTEEREIYKEGIYVGYRFHASTPDNVRYPFGFGLSYTKFEYSDLSVSQKGSAVFATLNVTNTGERFGGEVVQLYTSKKESNVKRPVRELRAFKKVYLAPGETETVTLALSVSDLAVFSIVKNRWIVESGEYEIELASDSLTVKLSESISVSGEKIEPEEYFTEKEVLTLSDGEFERITGVKISPKIERLPLTLESRFSNFKKTFFGRIIYSLVLSMPKSKLKKAKKLPEGSERENKIKGAIFLSHMLDSNSPNSMAMCAGKTLPYNFAEGLVHLANGKILKAIFCFLKRIKAPKLPK